MALLIRIYRVSRYLHVHGFTRVALIFKQLNVHLYGADISPGAVLGEVSIPHPSGVVIANKVLVEDCCQLLSGVVLGVTGVPGVLPSDGQETPIVRRGSLLGTGAKILGPIEIGADCIIGANAVVTRNIPRGSVAVGVPARVVRQNLSD